MRPPVKSWDFFAGFDGFEDGGTIIIERGDCAHAGFAFNGCTVTLVAITNSLVDRYCCTWLTTVAGTTRPANVDCASLSLA
jgi:hypothetical protein